MNQNKTKAIVEAGFITSITVILALLVLYVPIMRLLGPFLLPLPFAVLGYRRGIRWSLIMAAASTILVSLFAGPFVALMLCGSFSIVGIVLGEGFWRRWPAVRVLLSAAIAFGMAFGVVLLVHFYIMGVDIVSLQQQFYGEAAQQAFDSFETMGYNSIELDKVKTSYLAQLEEVKRLFLFSFAAGALLLAYIDFRICVLVFRRLGEKVIDLPLMQKWEMPRAVLYLYLVSMVGELYGSYVGTWFVDLAFNIKWVCIFTLWIQGLAVLWYAAERWPILRLTKWFIAAFSLIVPFFTYALFFTGLLDMGLNYRKRRDYL